MKAIIGTAGHIDHGKTAMVRALTGIDTDRLPEERVRGISIELGFAYLELDSGERAGIVDVPGHERFVRQMLAGAQGFDLVIMVVAADDGVMPQTEEHFEICHLLGVRSAIFVITKADLADAARIEEVRGEIEILVAGTEFEEAPVVACSAHDGRGMDELRGHLIETLRRVERQPKRGPFRMPVDRAFVLKGQGVVVTGTAVAGSVAVGDDLVILPSRTAARAREIQVHDVAVERAFAGQRVALNLAGVDRAQVRRGDCIAAAGLTATSRRFDASVEIRPLAGKAIRSHERVRLYVGTQEAFGRIVWLGGTSTVAPRGSAYAQIVLQDDAIVFAGDRFVLRDETASRTIGGGLVLVAQAPKRRKADSELTTRLRVLETGDASERLAALVELVTTLGTTPGEAALGIGTDVDTTMRLAADSAALISLPEASGSSMIVASERYRRYRDELVAVTTTFHENHASSGGIELERLRAAMAYDVEPRLLRFIVDELVQEGCLVREGSIVSVPGHRASMSGDDEELGARLIEAIRDGLFMPPSLKQLQDTFGVPLRRVAEILGVLGQRAEAVKVTSDLYFASEALEEIERRLRGFFAGNETITAAEFRDLIAASRKYSIPVLDYFDRKGLTIRSGDHRRLRSQ